MAQSTSAIPITLLSDAAAICCRDAPARAATVQNCGTPLAAAITLKIHARLALSEPVIPQHEWAGRLPVPNRTGVDRTMRRHWLPATALISVFAVGFIPPAWADDPEDPSFVEMLFNNCPNNCSGVALAVDPISGILTVECAFKTSGSFAIDNVTPGDVEVLEPGGSTVGDLIRFEGITDPQTQRTTAVAFIFSNDVESVCLPMLEFHHSSTTPSKSGKIAPDLPLPVALPTFLRQVNRVIAPLAQANQATD
jgi:hypothetical protein